MEYIVIGGDARFEALARLLSERGESVGVVGREARPWARAADAQALGRAGKIVVNCPPKANMALVDVLNAASDDAKLFTCGPGHPDATDRRLIDLWTDEALLTENARMTAEGALASAMRASSSALGGMRCMVIGWGRIGRALTELLVALGARVTVCSRTPAGRNRAAERGAEACDTGCIARSLPGHKLIYNTAPAMLLDAAALSRVDSDAMLIDLASPPYGVDLPAAWSLGLRAWREPGLPGRYCPHSAALAILGAMDRQERGEGSI